MQCFKFMTQEEQVIGQLNTIGLVSRNWALKNFITRLGAIMCNLKKEGWEFNSFYQEYAYGKDFVYKLVNKPKPAQTYSREVEPMQISKEQKIDLDDYYFSKALK